MANPKKHVKRRLERVLGTRIFDGYRFSMPLDHFLLGVDLFSAPTYRKVADKNRVCITDRSLKIKRVKCI